MYMQEVDDKNNQIPLGFIRRDVDESLFFFFILKLILQLIEKERELLKKLIRYAVVKSVKS